MIRRNIDSPDTPADSGTVVEPRNQSTSILLVDDDPNVVSAVGRHLRPFRSVLGAVTYTEAMALLDAGTAFCGAIVDAKLDDGRDGLEIVARLRKRLPHVPVIVLTGDPAAVLGRAYTLRADVLQKGTASAHLTDFATRCIRVDQTDDPAIAEAIGVYAREHGLNASETEVVRGALDDRRAEWFVEHGVARSTYKTRVNSVLEKTGAQSLSEVAAAIFRLALRLVRESQAI